MPPIMPRNLSWKSSLSFLHQPVTTIVRLFTLPDADDAPVVDGEYSNLNEMPPWLVSQHHYNKH